MKKSIFALMGLFTLVACGEDAYLETDKTPETGTVDNNSDGTMMPMTVSAGYDSPFQPYGSSFNKDILTTFRNNTPLLLELEPYGEVMHAQTFLLDNGKTCCPPPDPDTSFNAIASTNFVILPGTVETNRDPGAPLAVNALPYSNSTGTIIYDFGSFTTNYRMLHYGKIYYFKYKVYNSMGVPFEEGYIKHQFYSDIDDAATINANDPNWEKVGNADGLLPMYDVAVMYHTSQDEMCLTNKDGYTTPPLPSSVGITDPATGIVHTLSFTSNTAGVYVNFN